MPEDLLLGLESAVPVAGRLANIDDLMRVVIRELGWAMEDMVGSALVFENAWRRIIKDIARGQSPAIHAARPSLVETLELRLDHIRSTHRLAASLRGLGREDVPNPDVLLAEIAGLERLKASVFDRWQTLDDLEALAVEYYPLSASRLEALATSHPPPQTWYDEGTPI
jgi:hypothetical protein